MAGAHAAVRGNDVAPFTSVIVEAADPCPREQEAPHPAPSPVDDSESLVRLVASVSSIVGADNTMRLSPGSFARSDIRGTREADGRERSVSTYRRELTPHGELLARAHAHNQERVWSDDPVVAVASVKGLRTICDQTGRREFCVYAEPTSETEDRYGSCPTHAGIKRSKPEQSEMQRVEINILRSKIAGIFGPLERLVSGKPL